MRIEKVNTIAVALIEVLLLPLVLALNLGKLGLNLWLYYSQLLYKYISILNNLYIVYIALFLIGILGRNLVLITVHAIIIIFFLVILVLIGVFMVFFLVIPALIGVGVYKNVSFDGYEICLCAGGNSEQDRSQMSEQEGQEPLPGQERDPTKKYHFCVCKDGKVRMSIYPDVEGKVGKLPLEKEIEERFSKTKSKDEAEKVSDELTQKVVDETDESSKSFKDQNDQVIDIITNCPELNEEEKQRKIDEFTVLKDKDLVLADEWASESKSSIEKKYVDTCKSFDKEEQSGDNNPSEDID